MVIFIIKSKMASPSNPLIEAKTASISLFKHKIVHLIITIKYLLPRKIINNSSTENIFYFFKKMFFNLFKISSFFGIYFMLLYKISNNFFLLLVLF